MLNTLLIDVTGRAFIGYDFMSMIRSKLNVCYPQKC